MTAVFASMFFACVGIGLLEAASPPGFLDQYYYTIASQRQVYGSSWRGQTFTVSTFSVPGKRNLVSVRLYLNKNGSPPTPLIVEVRNTTGLGLPGSTVIASARIEPVDVQAYDPYDWGDVETFYFSGCALDPGVKYALILRTEGGDVNNCYNFRCSGVGIDNYTRGGQVISSNSGTSWTKEDSNDFWFETYLAHLESYKDPSYTTLWGTEAQPYGDDSQNVYIAGSGFKPGTAYHVVYYDSDGRKVASEGVTSDTSGNIGSICSLKDSAGAVNASPWHAVVYEDGSGNAPDEYVPSDANIVLDDEFYVSPAAIPEFPGVFSAGVALSLCTAGYFWLRKRHVERLDGCA